AAQLTVETRRILDGASAVVFTNDVELTKAHELLGRAGAPDRRWKVIRYGTPDPGYRERDADRADRARVSAHLGFMGRLHEKKNVHGLIRSLSDVTVPVQLDVVGPGADRYLDQLHQLAAAA